MPTLSSHINPFALMLDPQGVFAQIEHSERLERLSRRVCRPLDKPVLGAAADGETEADAGDGAASADAVRGLPGSDAQV